MRFCPEPANPNGDEYLAAGSGDGTARIYNSSTGAELFQLAVSTQKDGLPVTCVRWRPVTALLSTPHMLLCSSMLVSQLACTLSFSSTQRTPASIGREPKRKESGSKKRAERRACGFCSIFPLLVVLCCVDLGAAGSIQLWHVPSQRRVWEYIEKDNQIFAVCAATATSPTLTLCMIMPYNHSSHHETALQQGGRVSVSPSSM